MTTTTVLVLLGALDDLYHEAGDDISTAGRYRARQHEDGAVANAGRREI